MKTLTVTAVKHKDIRDNELLYVILENEKGIKVVINVGQKTYDGVKNITETDEAKLLIEKLETDADQEEEKLKEKKLKPLINKK